MLFRSAGFRWHKTSTEAQPLVGSLLLGLFNDRGKLQHVGVVGAFTAKRRAELVDALSQPLLDFIAAEGSAVALLGSGYGCQFLTEILLNGVGNKDAALDAVAALASASAFSESESGSGLSRPNTMAGLSSPTTT